MFQMQKHSKQLLVWYRFEKLRECNIENIDGLLRTLCAVLQIMQDTDYDILDNRLERFSVDYRKFMEGIHNIEGQVEEFITDSFSKVTSAVNAMSLLEQFQV
jgi:hypothetical protein